MISKVMTKEYINNTLVKSLTYDSDNAWIIVEFVKKDSVGWVHTLERFGLGPNGLFTLKKVDLGYCYVAESKDFRGNWKVEKFMFESKQQSDHYHGMKYGEKFELYLKDYLGVKFMEEDQVHVISVIDYSGVRSNYEIEQKCSDRLFQWIQAWLNLDQFEHSYQNDPYIITKAIEENVQRAGYRLPYHLRVREWGQGIVDDETGAISRSQVNEIFDVLFTHP